MPESRLASTDPSLGRRALAALRDVPDFPKAGIVFKDITPLLADAALFVEVTRAMAAPFADAGVTHVVGIESRGFILGGPIAQHLGAGFVPVRKPGKLPWHTRRREYALEYGSDALEAHADACEGACVLVVDDVLATGGTAAAACALVEDVGGRVVACSFLLEIVALAGSARLAERSHATLVRV